MFILEKDMEHLPQAYSYFDDEEFCQSLLKDLQSFTSLPESPSIKTGLPKGDRLSFVSDVLLQDDDMQLSWNCSIVQSDDDDYDDDGDDDDSGSLGSSSSSEEEDDDKESREESTLRNPGSEEKTAPSASDDVDANVSEEPAGSTQNRHDVTESQETDEFTSDYYSTGDESSNQSEEEIDVVTVKHEPVGQQLMNEEKEELVGQQLIDEEELAEHHARVSHIFEIEQKHNYAARPLCSPPTSGLKKWSHVHKAWITVDTEEEEKERRQTHNVLEKKRRKMMTKCFGRLRDTMPELYRNDKAPKILILERARDFIRDLEAQAYRLGTEENTLRARQEVLKGRLKHIKKTIGW
ncbi:myc proto-oncogene protein-like [Corythoichthys intestinalis]|uniref:myc proto-oncogene protein-like n=1 Tax=Corythoichthys intestinalis TaxID=161448 RepID=UPI0025A56FDF|nr:myc proto-oncogene protein-like [Corythoichthys intestinalis]